MSQIELISRIKNWYFVLSQRERLAIGLTSLVLSFYLLLLPINWFRIDYQDNQRLIGIRKLQYTQISELFLRYQTLNEQLVKVRSSYDKSQMSYGDVIARVQQVVQQTTETTDLLELDRMGEPESIGLNYRKQRFTLKIPSVELPQLIDILFQLEHGDNPLFLERLELNSTNSKGAFRINLLLSSIQKQQEM